MSDGERITVEVVLERDAATAFRAFTDPAAIVQWNFASPDWCCPRAESDLRVGGRVSYRMEARDGSFGFDLEGVFVEVEPDNELAYELADGRAVSVRFVADGNGTRVIESFVPEGTNPPEMQRVGWQAILDNYKRFAERS